MKIKRVIHWVIVSSSLLEGSLGHWLMLWLFMNVPDLAMILCFVMSLVVNLIFFYMVVNALGFLLVNFG
jgi:hypothetical protein